MHARLPAFILCLLALTGWTRAADEGDALKAGMDKPWKELLITRFANVGPVIHSGICITRNDEEKQVRFARWEDKGKLVFGAPTEMSAGELARIVTETLAHYRAALASDDLDEQIDKIEPEAERERIRKAVRDLKPINGCGQGSFSIELRVMTGDGASRTYVNRYGLAGFEAFDRWLKTLEDSAK